MPSFPILETSRLILRQLQTEDAKDLYDYFSKDEVTQYYDLESFTEIGQAEHLIHNWNDKYENQQGIRWGITIKPENRIIGTFGFVNRSIEHFKAEIGFELAPQYWLQGIMTEVLQVGITYGLKELGLNRIEALIDPDNLSSRKLLEKAGFQEEGHLKDYFYEKNQFVDAVMFAIVKREYIKDDSEIQ
ncbi:ribosomal-protein-alanine N-acetyltransferase [Paenibacillus sp. 1_12]|uniref:GNAT family N-acetyltransferase n=1 Tax=Paenibacillus sp. 1_12 TaxID=1566278 RepID=UPI0008E91DFC|nr:GNAT family protein [Paenibacillus sp. 1_12]SFL56026.1 ribosomal-protein-alanine N-acetyltransferase [Paenibacillus sp. 1_12]